MISEVRISDVGVIAEAVLELDPGFTAITGETGAGKTMVLTGLALMRGAKVDPALVRRGAAMAAVDGRVSLPADSPAALRVLDLGGVIEDGELLVSRTLPATGRGRAALGGRSVPTGVLTEVVDQLVAVHGQNDQLRLGRSQLSLLDRWAGPAVADLLGQYRQRYQRYVQVQREIRQLREQAAERASRIEFLAYNLEEIDRIRPEPGEDASLSALAQRLGNAEVLRSAVSRAAGALAGDDDGLDAPDALGLVATARRAVDSVREYDEALSAPLQTIAEAAALLADAAADLSSYAAGIDADPSRLAAVEDRRAELAKLTRKHGPSVDDVLAWEARAATELADLQQADAGIAAREDEVAEIRQQMGPLAQELHTARSQAAQRFAQAATAELAALAMPRATLGFRISTAAGADGLVAILDGIEGTWQFGPDGFDDAQITLVSHPGAPERPVATAASGGELSRIMLAVHVVLAGADPVATMVFDEVDAGVGGAAALEVGRRLAMLAQGTQVLVVTHLAQVAAFADRHLVVSKSSDEVVTTSSIVRVEGDDRVREIARMLSGQADSEAAGVHASELLGLARSVGAG